MFEKLVRHNVRDLTPAVPGKTYNEIKREYGVDDVLRLGNNENPWGVSPRSVEAVRAELQVSNFYPDWTCHDLRTALAERHGVTPDEVTVSGGASNILTLITQAFVGPGDEVVMAAPTFPVYRRDVLISGGVPIEVPLKDFTHDLEAMASAVGQRTKAVIICNPNNPTGTVVAPSELAAFIDNLPESILVVLDDVYIDFVEEAYAFDPMDLIKAGRPIIVVRSFSKLYGLAGIRVGYALADAELIRYLNTVKEAFPVSNLAQAAALAALDDEPFREHVVRETLKERSAFARALQDMGLTCVPTQTNFVFMNFGISSKIVFQGLLPHGIIVAVIGAGPDSTWGRVTVGTPEQNTRFLQALKEVLSQA